MDPTIDLPKVKQLRWTSSITYDAGSVIAYHIALGVDGTDLPRCWEAHPSFHALPTFVSVAVIDIMGKVTRDMPQFLPTYQAHRHPHVHGEHYLELKRPVPTSATLVSEARVLDVVDRDGAGVAVRVGITTQETSPRGPEICYNEWTSFLMKMPGTGASKRQPGGGVPPPKNNRPPDAIVSHQTTAAQGALYRAAAGEWNPMHIDPETGKKAGFPGPILPGTCTIGMGVRHAIDTFAEDDSTLFKNVQLRLSKPVFPGETVRTEMWREDDGRKVVYQQVAPNGRVVISHAAVELGKKEKSRSQL